MPTSQESSRPPPGTLLREWHSFSSAMTFLTRVPLPTMPYSDAQLGRSVIYFPAVGLFVGAIAGAIFLLAQQFWPPPVAIVLSMIATTLCTGGFHEDGLADTADGIGGGWSREDKLTIMKDSRIGTYGGLALILSALLRLCALMAIPEDCVPNALIVGHVLGRWSTLPLLRYGHYIGGGSGNPLVDSVSPGRLAIGSVMAALFVLAWATPGATGLIVSAMLVTFLCGVYFRRALGGITGDTLGAANQLVEIVAYLSMAAMMTP